MIKEMEDWIDEIIDDLEPIELNISDFIDCRLADEILKHCGIGE